MDSNAPIAKNNSHPPRLQQPQQQSADSSNRHYYDLQSLQESIDIVDVVASYELEGFALKANGQGATALCPFHNDRHPSLSVDNARGLYKCFACGAAGNMFDFVRRMHALSAPSDDEMTYYQAVRWVAEEFGSGPTDGNQRIRQSLSFGNKDAVETLEQRHKRERIYLANAAAAAFYLEGLTHPTAGGARHYLMSQRLLTPATVRRFALGYAPDTYFGTQAAGWGSGSLVQHLQRLNFTAPEIVEAGLAVVLQKRPRTETVDIGANDKTVAGSARNLTSANATTSDSSNRNQTQHVGSDDDIFHPSFDNIMDRFRDRIIVPILDDKGQHILGFGGRILPPLENNQDNNNQDNNQKRNFEMPKYLNSPETLAFHKQHILFGQHLANEANNNNKDTESFSNAPSLVVVEGYLDAVSLSSVGIDNVVATMGTAISSSQLEKAVQSVTAVQNNGDADDSERTTTGTVVLCMDHDDAGQSAVERLCRDRTIANLVAKHNQKNPMRRVQFKVATAPTGFTDPAEFVEHVQQNGDGDAATAAKRVQREILGPSVPWSHWYLERIVGALRDKESKKGGEDEDDEGGATTNDRGNDIFYQLASLISEECLDRTEQKELAHMAASSLVPFMEQENNNSSSSSAKEIPVDIVQHQLESDLMDLASRIAGTRNISGMEAGSNMVAGPFNKGRVQDISNDDKLSKRNHTGSSLSHIPRVQDIPEEDKTAKYTGRKQEKQEPTLTQHYSGWTFKNPADQQWIESTDGGRGNLVLDRRSGRSTWRRRKDHVFFNSNTFHGGQFLTEQARLAGYSGMEVKKDPSIFEKGVSSLLELDAAAAATAAETTLLREMILNPAARTFVKNWLQARAALHGGESRDFQWTSPEKKWLFQVLSNKTSLGAVESNSPEALRQNLVARDDVPVGSFVLELSNEETSVEMSPQGTLEDLFVPLSPSEAELFSSSTKHQEHHWQCVLGALLSASARLQVEALQSDILFLSKRLALSPSVNATSPPITEEPADANDTETRESLNAKLWQLGLATQRQRDVEESRRQASTRALDATNTVKVEGRVSVSAREQLCSQVNDFATTVGQKHPERVLADNLPDMEPLEMELEQMDMSWAAWNDDSDNVGAAMNPRSSSFGFDPSLEFEEEVEEDESAMSLEEFFEHVEKEWGDYCSSKSDAQSAP